METTVSNEEYNKLVKKIEFFETTRNSLLTFSFTAVLTVIGVALAMDMNVISAWICLLPFFLIIPFTARISYYRLATAHIGAFLKCFAPQNMQFEIGADFVKEGNCRFYTLTAWLITHEMVLLGIAVSFVFYLKYIPSVEKWNIYWIIGLFVPIILSGIVYMIAESTYNYGKVKKNFEKQWDVYRTSL